jgi:hypothetical protein
MPANATARATRPSDLLLMLLRILLVLAAGTALAKPVFTTSRVSTARVILADVSRSVRDSAGLRDSVRALFHPGDALILFDSSTREISAGAGDSAASLSISSKRGNISAAMVAAMRAGARLRDRADSLELVIVSPFAAEEMDAATDSIRNLWPGRARLVNLRASGDSAGAARVIDVAGTSDDPLLATVSLARGITGANALIVRGDPSSVEVPRERAFVSWPRSSRPERSIARARVDTVGGVIADSAVVVGSLARKWTFPADSIRTGQVVARWIDGEPAAIEWENGEGCTRSVAIDVPSRGDFVIRSDFVRLTSALGRDCIRRRSALPASREALTMLAGAGRLAAREKFQAPTDVRSRLAPYLLAFAIAAAIAELFLRRRRNQERVRAASASQSREKAA